MDRSVKAYCNVEQLAGASVEFPYNPQPQREAYLYLIFHKYYPQTNAAQTVRKWIPRWQKIRVEG
jgi:asparagine synthase (glutamine-hydrolysing)